MSHGADDADMAAALGQFDRVAANIEKLESVWQRLCDLTPDDVAFGLDTPERENLVRSFAHISEQLPAIDGFRVEDKPMGRTK
jgi:hypothetical protein